MPEERGEFTSPPDVAKKLPDEDFLEDLRDKAVTKLNQEAKRRTVRKKTSEELARGINDRLAVEEIKDYAPCHLTETQQEQLLKIVNELAPKVTKEDQLHLAELYLFIKDHGSIFPEFSHGTSGGTLNDVLTNGIEPSATLDSKDKRKYGEGSRFGRNSEYLKRISAGVGLGGLGTAMAYAEATEHSGWNYRYRFLSEEDNSYIQDIKKTLSRPDISSDERTKMESSLKGAQEALQNHRAHSWEFPVIFGFNHSSMVTDINHPEIYWSTASKTQIEYGKVTSYKTLRKREATNSFASIDSELLLPSDDSVPADLIKVIACPAKRIDQVRRLLREKDKADISIISIEALKILPKLGIDRVEEARAIAQYTINNNLLAQ